MNIKFIEDTHTYLVDGEIASITVTELLAKHGIAPSYAKVDKALLKEKREKGKAIHKDLENTLLNAEYKPQTPYGEQLFKYIKKNIDCAVGEQQLAYEHSGMIVAGTTDLIGFEKDQTPFIADYKCMETIHKESVAWQLSLYDYFARKLEDNMLNGKKFFWKGAKKFIVFQCYEGKLKPIELEPIADTEIERLLQAEYENKRYQRPLLVIDSELKERYNKAELMLVNIEQNYEKAKAEAQELRNILLAEMEKQGIYSFETDHIKLTYIPQVERPTVDSGKLKKLYPQVYGNCTKIIKVKPSLRIKVKEIEEDEI